jgi:ribosomal protein S18 acetylase RimI-like enzyme
MKVIDCKIIKLEPKDNIPFRLLLLADETEEAIEKYIFDCEVYVATKDGQTEPIAVFALYKINNTEIEIKNIAVSEVLQGKGLGGDLITEIKKIAKRQNFKRIIVGTPDYPSRELRFYQKNGFAKCGIRKNFFVDNYAQPIIENGVRLKDMAILKLDL